MNSPAQEPHNRAVDLATPAGHGPATVRLFRPADEAQVRNICHATAFFGQSMAPVVADLRWVTDALLGYHLAVEPDLLFVAEAGGAVVGYLAGGSDALGERLWFRQETLWRLVVRALRSRRIVNARSLRAALAAAAPFYAVHRRWRSICRDYPAFLHVNLAAAWQGQGIGRRLLDEFSARLRERRIPGVHVSTATAAGQAFFAKQGFRLVVARPIGKILDRPPGTLCLMVRKP